MLRLLKHIFLILVNKSKESTNTYDTDYLNDSETFFEKRRRTPIQTRVVMRRCNESQSNSYEF